MSNFQEPKKQVEISFHTFADFLMVNGYVGKNGNELEIY